jgi:hypothetical protein
VEDPSAYDEIPDTWIQDGRLTDAARGLLLRLAHAYRLGSMITLSKIISDNVFEHPSYVRALVLELVQATYLTPDRTGDDWTYTLRDPFAS